MSTIWELCHIENNPTLYCGKDCMKKFCTSLREHPKNIIDFEMNKLLPLAKEELKSNQKAKVCYICRKKSLKSLLKIKLIKKSEMIVIIQGNITAQRIVFVI